MFRMFLVFFLATMTALSQDEGWSAVRQIESGTELRIYRKGEKKPLEGKMREAGEENLVVSVKKGQESVAKDQIERIDMRTQGSSYVKEKKGREVTVHAKPHYKTIYRP